MVNEVGTINLSWHRTLVLTLDSPPDRVFSNLKWNSMSAIICECKKFYKTYAKFYRTRKRKSWIVAIISQNKFIFLSMKWKPRAILEKRWSRSCIQFQLKDVNDGWKNNVKILYFLHALFTDRLGASYSE